MRRQFRAKNLPMRRGVETESDSQEPFELEAPAMTIAAKTVVIVGGGFSGAIFGLKLHRKCPDWRIVIAEPKKSFGRGVAYGACSPDHLLNVPVSRMEIGLVPSFADALQHARTP